MTATLLAVALLAGVVMSAVLGPLLLRRATPALVCVPRTAIMALVGGIAVWITTLLAIGPVLAWAATGPTLLPRPAAQVCQRCLAAANPFSADAAVSTVPAVLPLILPVALGLAFGSGIARRLLQRSQRSRAAAATLLHGARPAVLHGHQVSLVDTDQPFALTLPCPYGGIVVSTGAVHALEHDELAAVLAHERAHLQQRHHLVSALVDGLTAFLGWVPLIRAVADALPHYLEIAADDRARKQAGTPALVSALLTLGARSPAALPHDALHAAGPERIRHLVHPTSARAGALSTAAIAAYLCGMVALSAMAHLPYISAALTGCAI